MDSNVALLIGQMEIIAALMVIGFFEQVPGVVYAFTVHGVFSYKISSVSGST